MKQSHFKFLILFIRNFVHAMWRLHVSLNAILCHFFLRPSCVLMQCFPGTLIRCMDNELYKQTDKSEANIILCSSLEANTRHLQLTHVCSVLMFEPPPKYGHGSNNRNAPIILSLSRGSRLSAVKIVALCCHTSLPTS